MDIPRGTLMTAERAASSTPVSTLPSNGLFGKIHPYVWLVWMYRCPERLGEKSLTQEVLSGP